MNTTEQSEQIKASFGQWLKEERTTQKISREEISAKTSIRPSILEAIEAEAHEKLPATVYTVGFIRSYAREVGLDPDEVVRRYHLHRDSEADEKKRPGWNRTYETYTEPNRRFRWLFFLLAGVALVVVAWWGYFWLWPQIAKRLPSKLSIGAVQMEPKEVEPKTPMSSNKKSVSELAGEKKGVAVVSPSASSINNTPALTADPDPTETRSLTSEKKIPEPLNGNTIEPQPVTLAGTDQEKVPALSETAAAEDSSASSEVVNQQRAETKTVNLSSGFALTINALATTWLRVTPDDGPSREYTLRQGDQKEFQVSTQVKLLIGNAGGIALKVNGEHYPVAGKSGQVVRMTIP